VVGDGHGGHVKFAGFPEKVGQPYGAIEQAELRVDMQVDELGVFHLTEIPLAQAE